MYHVSICCIGRNGGPLANMPGEKSIAGVALQVSTLGRLAILKAMPLYRYNNALCVTRARNECHYSISLILSFHSSVHFSVIRLLA